MSIRRTLLAAWLLALPVHWAVTSDGLPPPDPAMASIGGGVSDPIPRIAYHEDYPDSGPVVLLIHGSPGEAGNFDQLRAELPTRFRVITPDLPGFGSSTRVLDDYSFTRHARDLVALMDSLQVGSVHAVGMSMGGGVALEMVRLAPDRVESVTLLSSIGLQEYELTGDYWTNHLLHGAQVGLVWVIDHLVPHFGWLDSGGLARSYARNFFDSDQRRLADTIRRWDGPTLILHGARDFLVPVAAARAHAEAIPQSVYREYDDGSHFLIWTRPEEVAADLVGFIDDSRTGGPPLATVPRSLPAPAPVSGPGLWLILVLAALLASWRASVSAWWFVPLARAGLVAWPLLVVAVAVGAALRPAVGALRARRIQVRPLVSKAALGAAWSVLLGLVATVVDLRSPAGAFVAALAVGCAMLLWRARSARGRARLRGQWLRLRRWEYWPGWAIYLPIVPRLARRVRGAGGVRSVLCVNPAIPLGGLAGESKADILRLLGARPEVPRWTLVEPGPLQDRRTGVESFLETLDEPWPFVIKPDRGERGSGVRIVRTPAQLDAALLEVRIPVLVQEFVPGVEFGVFWFRRPGGREGEVLSVAHKAMVAVVGDGRRTVDALIADHPRLVPHLDVHRARHAGRLEEVPAAGEEFQITELGTHALGATFIAANDLGTAALRDALDRLMDGTGLDFGRFDIRVQQAADLAAGRDLRVIEFNGLSAEAADIYDPDATLAAARARLEAQWAIAMEIGAANRWAGMRPPGWWQLGRTLHAHWNERSARGG